MRNGSRRHPVALRPALCVPRRRGFTLIELLIVIAIIGLLSASLGSILGQMSLARTRAEARAEALAAEERFTQRWRDDVRLARSVEIAPDGAAMTLEGTDASGAARGARYEIADGSVVRRASGSGVRPETILGEARGLAFERVGRGFRMTAVHKRYDGFAFATESLTTRATPLSALDPRGERP